MADSALRDAYYAYGVDLVRSAGLLLPTTPSVIYRAAMLFQRFEASVDTQFRSRYIPAEEMAAYRKALEVKLSRAERRALLPPAPAQSGLSTSAPASAGDVSGSSSSSSARATDAAAASTSGTEYLIPNHAQQEMRTGLVPLVDLRAPLDYCVHHLIDQEDVVYLAAACLLIATKMEDPTIRIRAVVNTCMRLSERRAGVVVNEQQKPPPARYEDFKSCVVDAEEVVLHQLGFQTFVESPYKYLLMYLHLLVEPAATKEADASPTTTDTTSTGVAPTTELPGTRAPPARPHAAALTQWLVRAVQLTNDLPRCRKLIWVPSDVLALYAIQHTCPADLPLPFNWTEVFGVPHAAVARVAAVYAKYLRSGIGSRRAATALAELRALRAVAPYRTVQESADYERAMKGLADMRAAVAGVGQGMPSFSHNFSPSPPPPSTMPGNNNSYSPLPNTAEMVASPFVPATAASIEELRDLIGAPSVAPSQTSGGRRDRGDASSFDVFHKRSRGDTQ